MPHQRRGRQGDCRVQEAIRLDPRLRAFEGRGTHGTSKANTTRQSPITPRRSGSIPSANAYSGRGAAWQGKRIRQGDRRFHRGDPARPEGCRAYGGRGIAWSARRRLRQGDRRFHRGDPARSQGRRMLTPSGGYAGYERRIRQGDRRLHRGDPARSQDTWSVQQPRQRWNEQRRLRQGDRRLHRGDPARSQVRRRLHSAARHRGCQRTTTTRQSPITARPSGSIPRTRGLTRSRRRMGGDQRRIRQGNRRLTTKRSGSIPITATHTPSGPRHCSRKANTTRQSPITARPFGSIPKTLGIHESRRRVAVRKGV